MALRNSGKYIAFTTASGLLMLSFALHAAFSGSITVSTTNRSLVKELHLTDLCLFTEARYTRHPSLADRHAPFQEHPTAFEHFPSGSLLLPQQKTTGSLNAKY
ncbi:MAG: hypothetical protein FIA91_11355 [Geobacter sp.]|nr:hypothetical protein [Geobacter sp.]